MQRNRYIGIVILLTVILIGSYFIWNIDFSSKNSENNLTKDSLPAHTGGVLPEKSVDKEKWTEGSTVFKMHCASCHFLNKDGVGPALMGVTLRWNAAGTYNGKTGEQWLKLWIKDWNQVVADGYPYGVSMVNSRQPQMIIFPMLSDKNIDDVLYYIENTYN